jgi:3-oxoacyl-[acyl-carrier-protein] synthase III
MTLRSYQDQIANDAVKLLKAYGICYLSMEVRCGKTITSLTAAVRYGAKEILFVTKKKAISSILSDHTHIEGESVLAVVNYEQLHNYDRNPDVIICDEAHCCVLGNTPIGSTKIKDIKVGSSVKSYNFANNKIENRKVLNVFKNPLTENLIKIKSNGKEIVCTESHEIYTSRGWVKAKDIRLDDEVSFL